MTTHCVLCKDYLLDLVRPQTLNLEQKLRELGRDVNMSLVSVLAIGGLMGSKGVHTKVLVVLMAYYAGQCR